MNKRLIHVAAGAIRHTDGRILITKRPDHVHQGGLWEFPGGKLETEETPEQGLVRELAEELGIRVTESRPLIRIHHDYGDRHVLLDVHRVDAFDGQPHGREGQPLDWMHPDAMDPRCFPAADRPIINALRLPDRFLITGADPSNESGFLARLDLALQAGIRLVQLRAHELDDRSYARLAQRVFPLCNRIGARLLLNRDPPLVEDLPTHGLHLTASRLKKLRARPLSRDYLVGASCHSAEELSLAVQLDLDYAVLSPVKPTRSHPDAVPLGWDRFSQLVDPIAMPVYALGGLGPIDLARAVRSGGQGVAGISGFWPGGDTSRGLV